MFTCTGQDQLETAGSIDWSGGSKFDILLSGCIHSKTSITNLQFVLSRKVRHTSRLLSNQYLCFQTYRAKNRTLYLRRKITTGRGRRSYQLKLVSTQRKNQHDQLMKNSWYYQFRNWFEITVLKSSTTKCHGCDKKVKKEDFDVKDFHDVSVNICKDCQKDI